MNCRTSVALAALSVALASLPVRADTFIPLAEAIGIKIQRSQLMFDFSAIQGAYVEGSAGSMPTGRLRVNTVEAAGGNGSHVPLEDVAIVYDNGQNGKPDYRARLKSGTRLTLPSAWLLLCDNQNQCAKVTDLHATRVDVRAEVAASQAVAHRIPLSQVVNTVNSIAQTYAPAELGGVVAELDASHQSFRRSRQNAPGTP